MADDLHWTRVYQPVSGHHGPTLQSVDLNNTHEPGCFHCSFALCIQIRLAAWHPVHFLALAHFAFLPNQSPFHPKMHGLAPVPCV